MGHIALEEYYAQICPFFPSKFGQSVLKLVNSGGLNLLPLFYSHRVAPVDLTIGILPDMRGPLTAVHWGASWIGKMASWSPRRPQKKASRVNCFQVLIVQT